MNIHINRLASKSALSLTSLIIPAIAAIALSSCNGGEAGSTPDTQSANAPQTTNSGGNTGAQTSGGVLGDSCVAGDANKICLGIHFVTYKDSSGAPVASTNQAVKIVQTMNKLWAQCDIGFQIDKYDAVDPTQYGLSYGAESQNETDKIRQTFGDPSNELLAVTTGPWGTSVNAWTNMPGESPYGAIMEASIVDYGGGIIYAHEFGHYLGLDHVSDTSNLMDAVIYTDSTTIDSGQCQTARDAATQSWSAMIRK